MKIIQEKQAKLPIIPIGTKTKFGKVGMVRTIEGERYYFMVDNDHHSVSMIPATAMNGLLLKR